MDYYKLEVIKNRPTLALYRPSSSLAVNVH